MSSVVSFKYHTGLQCNRCIFHAGKRLDGTGLDGIESSKRCRCYTAGGLKLTKWAPLPPLPLWPSSRSSESL